MCVCVCMCVSERVCMYVCVRSCVRVSVCVARRQEAYRDQFSVHVTHSTHSCQHEHAAHSYV